MLIRKSERDSKGDDIVSVYEYPFGNKDLDVAVAEINGLYPKEGFVINRDVDMIYYIISGDAEITVENKKYDVHEGDSLFIKKGNKYRINGKNLKAVLSSSPAWNPDQYIETN